MASTYTDTLPSNKDWVRFLIGDTDMTDAIFSDEEINAVIGEETATGDALKYFSAARCLSVLLTRWAGKGRGVVEKQVSKLRIEYGSGTDARQALEDRISELKQRGAWLLRPTNKSRVFRVL